MEYINLNYIKKDISKKKFNKLSLDLDDFIKELTVFSLDMDSSILGADLFMKLRGQGQEVEIFDCLIAAIIISNDSDKIVTNNQRHFERFESLQVIPF